MLESSVTNALKNVGRIVRNKSVENQTLPAKESKEMDSFLMIPEVITEQVDIK